MSYRTVLTFSAASLSALGMSKPAARPRAAPPPHRVEAIASSRGWVADFAYTVGRHRYRVATTVHRTQNQAGGRAPFEFSNTTTMDVTVTLTPRGRDTLALTVTVDSVSVESDLNAPQPNLEEYRGATLTGLVSPRGRVFQFAPPAGTPEGTTTSLYRGFRRFLVAFPNGTLGPGVSWSDTTTDLVRVGGFDTHTVTIANSRITGDTTYAGQQAWRIERNATITTTGDQDGPGGKVHLSRDATIRAAAFVAVSGTYLGETATETDQILTSKPDEPGVESMPIQQSIKTTVSEMTTAAR